MDDVDSVTLENRWLQPNYTFKIDDEKYSKIVKMFLKIKPTRIVIYRAFLLKSLKTKYRKEFYEIICSLVMLGKYYTF